MNKQKLCFLMAAVLMTGSLAGCGQETSKSGDTTTISVWTGDSHSKKLYDELVSNWNNTTGKEKGIYIDYQVKSGDSVGQMVELGLQNGDAPEFFGTGSMQKMIEEGYISPIDELPGAEEYLKKYDGMLYENINTYQGKTYTVPVAATTRGLLYNKDLFKACGIVDENGEAKAPVTWDEVREAAKKLTDTSKQQYGIILPMKWAMWFSSDISETMQSSCGHLGYDPVKNDYNYDVLVPVMKTYLGMKEDGSIFPGAESLDNDSARAQFAAGKIGMKMAYSFDVGVLNDQFPAECDWGVAPLPVVDENNRYMQKVNYASSFYINSKAIEKCGADKVMEVYKFFTSDELIKKVYEAGLNIPYNFDIVKDCNTEKLPKGWKEFSEIVDISHMYPLGPSVDMGTNEDISTMFINEVWNGSKSCEEIVDTYESNIRAGREKYAKDHPEEDTNRYADPNWNIKRQ